jgi:hypothetical protein
MFTRIDVALAPDPRLRRCLWVTNLEWEPHRQDAHETTPSHLKLRFPEETKSTTSSSPRPILAPLAHSSTALSWALPLQNPSSRQKEKSEGNPVFVFAMRH